MAFSNNDSKGLVAGPESPGDEDPNLENLRELIFGKEKKRLDELLDRIEDPEKFSIDLGKAIHLAIKQSHESGNKLSDSLFPVIENAILKSVKKDSRPLVDAIFPIMGPAIRKSIAEAFKDMIQSMNKMLENSFSINGIKWRIKSITTGKPFAEIVLLHNLVYKVQHIFLIHHKTGLLVSEVMDSNVPSQDADLVSSMLTAISDFVRDSFNTSPGEELDMIEVGEHTVWIVQGPYALIAAVVKGEAPENLRVDFQQALELIHKDFSVELKDFDGDTSVFGQVDEILTPCLKTHEKRPSQKLSGQKKPFWSIGILSIIFILILTWAYFNYTENKKWSGYTENLKSEPGIIVTETGKKNGQYYIYGLKDRLSADPIRLLNDYNIDRSDVESHWDIYSSLSPDIILLRAENILGKPENVEYHVYGDTLLISGDARHKWIEMVNANYKGIIGIAHLNTDGLDDIDLGEIYRLKANIENVSFYFGVGLVELTEGQNIEAGKLVEDLDGLLTYENNFIIEIYGETDGSGTESINKVISFQRALSIKRLLLRNGIAENLIRIIAEDKSQQDNITNTDINRRRVYLRIVFPGASN